MGIKVLYTFRRVDFVTSDMFVNFQKSALFPRLSELMRFGILLLIGLHHLLCRLCGFKRLCCGSELARNFSTLHVINDQGCSPSSSELNNV